ncbi:MAG: butyrate kinase [Clostridia bacterium]|nr:butyrate kinase [Clostridia bacterium]
MEYNIFAVNPGSTSTKVALFRNSDCIFNRVVRHSPDELKEFTSVASQFEYRFDTIKKAIQEENIKIDSVDAFVGRGGLLRPLKGGTYIVGQSMLDDLMNSKYGEHASNLGAVIASKFAWEYGKKAYIVDPVVVDELMDIARYSGIPEIPRKSVFHALNQKAAALRASSEAGIDYTKGRFIITHLGGGITVGAHDCGRVTDVNNGLEEGPFSPERAGSVPSLQLVEICFSGKYSKDEIKKMLVGKGGLVSYTGTSDCEVLVQMAEKDEKVKKILDAMIYQISREICASAAALCGKIDRIVITGGLAFSKYIVEEIKKRVSFLGEIVVYPGEDEMSALSNGVLRVLEGKETANEY